MQDRCLCKRPEESEMRTGLDLKKQDYQINKLYPLNIHKVTCQLYLNEKSLKKKKKKESKISNRNRRATA